MRRSIVLSSLLALAAVLVWIGLAGGSRGAKRPEQPVPSQRPPGEDARAPAELATTMGERVNTSRSIPPASEPDAGARPGAPGGGTAAAGKRESLRLTGTLRSAESGAPVAGAVLSFHAGAASALARTDAEGRFETEFALVEGYAWVGLAAGAERAQPGEVTPPNVLLPEAAAAPLDLRLIEPNAWLRVLTRTSGAPVRAHVVASSRSRIASGTSDERGELALAFLSLPAGARVRVYARAEGLCSAETFVVHPWPDEPVPIELAPSASIRVRVVDAAARPVPDVAVHVEPVDLSGRTDERGELELASVPPGDARVEVRSWDVSRTVTVSPGERVELELALPPAEVVVAGRVVDERGEGIRNAGVDARAPGWFGHTSTLRDGSFEIHAEPGRVRGLVRVMAGGSAEDDPFEPEERDVVAGTRDVVFRRGAPLEEVEASFALLDARTRELVPRGLVAHFRERWPDHWDSYFASGGLTTCSLKPRDDVRFLVRAPGHREVALAWRDVEAAVRAGKTVRVELAEGFEQLVHARSSATHEPLAGAAVFADGERVASTDAFGSTRVRLAAWPTALRIELDGYREIEIEAVELMHEIEGVFWLEPLE